MSENHHTVEIHGCIVCGKLHEVLVVYSPQNTMVDCKVTTSDGHCLPEMDQPFVACNIHTDEEVAKAYVRWQARIKNELEGEEDG
jgi:hypothetical protein